MEHNISILRNGGSNKGCPLCKKGSKVVIIEGEN